MTLKQPNPPKAEKTWPQFLAAFLANDFAGIANQTVGSLEAACEKIPPEALAVIVRLNHERFLDRQQVRRIVRWMLTGGDPSEETIVDLRCAASLALHCLWT
jgi:hypothetical protein